MRIQCSTVEPKALETRTAISGESEVLPLITRERVWRVTPRRLAASVRLSPEASNGMFHQFSRMNGLFHRHVEFPSHTLLA